ncbi:hypothetical protein ACFQGE_13000 [Halomicroarcula sp. GCM10025817]|uniref:hypothetical protein n=1 Tax=Haloarcula TaxID=2237 RepID=UPI0023E8C7E8|nr:hypothetical protein [Halomicroarcula sp. SYNS111]
MSEDTNGEIAKAEADETFRSISNLDSISDTAIVGITFLLAALGTWITFAYNRLAGLLWAQGLFVALGVVCVLMIVLSITFLTDALAPRKFYGEGVGQRFLDHRWLVWRNDDPVDLQRYARSGDIETPADLEDAVESWIDDYDQDTTVDSKTAFEYARLLNYKVVARQKARNTAYGMAFLRIAVVALASLIVVGLLAPFLTNL